MIRCIDDYPYHEDDEPVVFEDEEFAEYCIFCQNPYNYCECEDC